MDPLSPTSATAPIDAPFADPSPWNPAESPKGEHHLLQLIGDEQYFDDPEALGLYRSLTVLGVGPPGLRLPGMNFGIPFLHETFAQDIPPEYQELYQGMINMGDMADIASTEEIRAFIHTLARLKEMNKTYPVGRLLLSLIGNHDVLHAGTANSGSNFFGLLGIALDLQWNRNYSRDVHEAEVGSRKNILNKERLIEFIYKFFLEEEPDYVQLDASHGPLGLLYREQTSPFADAPAVYKIKGQKEKNWSDTKTVFSDFWRQAKDGSFNALVQYLPKKNKRPEQSRLLVSAAKMEDLQTANGNHPVYFIALDTMDYLRDGFGLGGTQGHVSSIQVQLVNAFIAEMKARNPNVQPKFILGGHFPATNITRIKVSGLSEILSDEDVIAYVAGHTHERGFEDLAGSGPFPKHGIKRSTSLPMITVPSIMDYPNESVFLKYGVEDPAANELYFEFTFHGLDWTKVPGLNGDVMHELREIYPYLDSFTVALSKIDHQEHLRHFADPKTPIYDKIYLALSLDSGLLTRPGAVNDFVITHDVIPTMVENNVLYKRLFLSMVRLNLITEGLRNEADSVSEVYLDYLNGLTEYYERTRKADYSNGDGPHQEIHHLDEHHNRLHTAINQLNDIADVRKNERLKEIVGILRLMLDDMNYFMGWIIRYETLRRSRARDADYRKMTDLFGNRYFKAIRSHLWDMPSGTSASAFAVLANLVSSEMYRDYRRPLVSQIETEKEVPDQIRLEVSTKTGNISWQTNDLPDPPSLPPFDLISQRAEPEEKTDGKEGEPHDRPPRWHWQFRTGGYLGGGTTVFDAGEPGEYQASGYNNGVHADFGAQVHLLSKPKAPRINLQANIGVNSEFQKRHIPVAGGTAENTTLNFDVPVQAALTVGDPFGLFDVGPVWVIGPSLVEYDTDPLDGKMGPFEWSRLQGPGAARLLTGAGIHLNLLEGAFWVQHLHENYTNLEGDPFRMNQSYWMAGVDFFQLARWANLRDRDN